MKKIFLVTAFFALFAGSVFAQGRNFVIDLGDTTNGKTVKIVKNPYGTNYQNENPPTFTSFFTGNLPAIGDTIEVFYKFKSNVDIPALTIDVVDNSQAANWWLAISDRYESIRGIKAGALVEGSIKYKVVAKPVSAVTVQLLYNDRIDSLITLEKAGYKTGRK